MQNTTFFTLLRTYAAQARRRGKSYGSQVSEIVRLRSLSIDAGEGSDEEKEKAKAALRAAVRNEYQPHDQGFDLPT